MCARRSIRLEGELTSVKISQDAQFALINCASDNGPSAVRPLSLSHPFLSVVLTCAWHAYWQEIHLMDLATQQVVRKYAGHSQSKHVIRSCFGGVEGAFVASGSEGASCFLRPWVVFVQKLTDWLALIHVLRVLHLHTPTHRSFPTCSPTIRNVWSSRVRVSSTTCLFSRPTLRPTPTA